MIGIEYGGDKDDKDEQGSELGAEIVGIFAVVVAVVEAPEKGGGDGNFDVLPSGLVDSGEEADGAVLAGEVVKKVGESAGSGDDDNTEPHDKSAVHELYYSISIS